MKIILVAPKSISKNRFDYAFWNFYVPLNFLGHETKFFDTSRNGDKELKKQIEVFKPDLLFCIMTGDINYSPQEPWETIKEETNIGRLKTFNWYCDDTWRFNEFSKSTCNYFHFCSTPELKFVEEYKKNKYNNIIFSPWHANSDLYSNNNISEEHLLCFVGQMHSPDRANYLEFLKNAGFLVHNPNNNSFEDMVYSYSNSLIGLNFSKNKGRTQTKARVFEIPATNTLLLTEYHDELQNYFVENKEMATFKGPEELIEKIKFFQNNKNIVKKISKNGHERFLKEHDSKIRLKELLEKIK